MSIEYEKEYTEEDKYNSCFNCTDLVKCTNGYYQCDKLKKWIDPENPDCNKSRVKESE